MGIKDDKSRRRMWRLLRFRFRSQTVAEQNRGSLVASERMAGGTGACWLSTMMTRTRPFGWTQISLAVERCPASQNPCSTKLSGIGLGATSVACTATFSANPFPTAFSI